MAEVIHLLDDDDLVSETTLLCEQDEEENNLTTTSSPETEAEEEVEPFEETEEAEPSTDHHDDPMITTMTPMTDISKVKQRIDSALEVVCNWSKHRRLRGDMDPTFAFRKDRADYLSELSQDLSLYYEYNSSLVRYLVHLLPLKELIPFFDANECSRPITLRANLLKITRRDLVHQLQARGCHVEPVGDWTKVGLKVIETTVPVGATPEYLSGFYIIQSASSLLPVMALAPQPGEKVLDMAAAPGGKTTHISQLMKNRGILYANDVKKERCKALVANIHRLGITNTIVSNMDGRKLTQHLPLMDRVLLDAPCSGLGIISKDKTVKFSRDVSDFQTNSHLQKQLLNAAIDLVDAQSSTGGYIVYSTCSISVEENEAVIHHALNVRYVKLVPFGLEHVGNQALSRFRQMRFHPSIRKYCRRILPHLHNMDGFFIAKLLKIKNGIKPRVQKHRTKKRKFNNDEEEKKDEKDDEKKESPLPP